MPNKHYIFGIKMAKFKYKFRKSFYLYLMFVYAPGPVIVASTFAAETKWSDGRRNQKKERKEKYLNGKQLELMNKN